MLSRRVCVLLDYELPISVSIINISVIRHIHISFYCCIDN